MRAKLLLLALLIPFILPGQPSFLQDYPDTISHKRLHTVIITEGSIYISGLYFLGGIWYKDKLRVPFHYYDDSKGYLQMDKWGHAFAAYYESYHAYYGLRWAGVEKKKALLWGGPIGLIFQTPIEVFDGLYEHWGFSWPDMIANAFGSVLFSVQEGLWNDQVVVMKFSYSPSPYPKYYEYLGRTHVERFFLDYNGHSHWLSINLKTILGGEKTPPWLNLAIGYSGNGMIREFENPVYYKGKPFPFLERYRQYLISLDVDLTKVPSRRPGVRKLFKYLNMVKVPFPALELNRVDGVKGHWMYY